jgi:hypothetical protein
MVLVDAETLAHINRRVADVERKLGEIDERERLGQSPRGPFLPATGWLLIVVENEQECRRRRQPWLRHLYRWYLHGPGSDRNRRFIAKHYRSQSRTVVVLVAARARRHCRRATGARGVRVLATGRSKEQIRTISLEIVERECSDGRRTERRRHAHTRR